MALTQGSANLTDYLKGRKAQDDAIAEAKRKQERDQAEAKRQVDKQMAEARKKLMDQMPKKPNRHDRIMGAKTGGSKLTGFTPMGKKAGMGSARGRT